MTTASSNRSVRVFYDPVEDELTVAVSDASPGIYVHEVDDGLYACIDEAGNITHICAEQATLGRSSSWRVHLSDVAGSGVLAALDALAMSGEPATDRPVEVLSEELPRLTTRWQAMAAEEAAARAAIPSAVARPAASSAGARWRIAELTSSVRDRVGSLADAVGATFDSLGLFEATLGRQLGVIESPGRTAEHPSTTSLDVQVDRAAEIGLESQGSLELDDALAEVRLRASGPGPHKVIVVLLDDAGAPVADPVLLVSDQADLTARLALERSIAPRDVRMILLSPER